MFDRSYTYNRSFEELNKFEFYDDPEKQKIAYVKHFGLKEYQFPRDEVTKVKLFKNHFLISRLTAITTSEQVKSDLIIFFNNPDNFDWSETTWNVSDTEYIIKFYNNKNKIVGKVWLCMTDCWKVESMPFTPNIKYGGLSKTGAEKLKAILNEIL